MPKINPFEPYSPVHPGMFVGRLSEVERLESALIQTKSAQPNNFMITGERGIGKSSLLNYIKFVAEGSIHAANTRFSFLVLDTDIDSRTT
ncbi:MAG: ATP-binding protein, partial [Acidobacteria bacterium]